MGDDVTQEQAFGHANDVLKNAVGGMREVIHDPGLVNVDCEHLKTAMSEPGKAIMGTAPWLWPAAQVDALVNNGMVEIEIPAFPRQKAD